MNRRVLVLGATGMLGHTLIRELDAGGGSDVFGTARRHEDLPRHFPRRLAGRIIPDVDALDPDRTLTLLAQLRPDLVVNAIGVIKQRSAVRDAVHTIRLNALFPHLLAQECAARGIRLVTVSTDCVFSGDRGNYLETDIPDPPDLYGRSKLLGEVAAPALTLRTSIVGHELGTNRSLVDWFLSQHGEVKGYTKANYSGVTTVEFARFLRTVVIPRDDLTGLYHLAAAPISKYHLLRIVADVYGWPGRIVPEDGFRCDRALSADRLRAVTGYQPPTWPEMIRQLHTARARWGSES
ncbi:dTDP-4-dehydrorhamnose reductase family protein [Micromonospora radicis]|uniref:dTDP-4-dehydrorhamnose reductase n=1 Tax=Micromonospora radicis TaxID=1894971 RepID=A0A418MX85_9ACTN|nr:SDR family oxidoreductase [Micromonospora radicis]RIV39646.1 SDR family oxidoreductase [Micromonospora radicis]